MDSARISALLETFLDAPLAPAQLDQISTYIDLLLRWNARINLTAIRDPEQIVPRHFGESFFLARHLFPTHKQGTAPPFAPFAKGGNTSTASTQETQAPAAAINSGETTTPARVIDLGSGAGFPALPIKIWAPKIHLTLIEANHKKAAFLREVVRSLTLTNVDVIPERAETVLARLAPGREGRSSDFNSAFPHQPSHHDPSHPRPPGSCHSVQSEESAVSLCHQVAHGPADVVTLRAVEKFERILPLAASFLAPHGRLALLISSAQESKLNAVPYLDWHTKCIPKSRMRILAVGEQANKVG